MFRAFYCTHSKTDKTIKHINTSKRRVENEKEVIVAMVIDNLQTYRKKNIFHLVRAPCFHRFEACSALGALLQNSRDYIACASNEITLHRAISFTASQLNGLFSLLFFYVFFMCGGLRFYGQNSWFSDIIFEHHNNFLSNSGR